MGIPAPRVLVAAGTSALGRVAVTALLRLALRRRPVDVVFVLDLPGTLSLLVGGGSVNLGLAPAATALAAAAPAPEACQADCRLQHLRDALLGEPARGLLSCGRRHLRPFAAGSAAAIRDHLGAQL